MSPSLRPAVDADQEAIRAIYNDAVRCSTAIYTEVERTPDAQRAWFAGKRAGGWPVSVATDAAGAVLGFASYGPFRPFPGYAPTVENSLYVAEAARGRGVASALLAALLRQARAAGLHAMVAGIDGANHASFRLHEKFGFTEVGRLPQVAVKFGRRLDLVFYHRLLNDGAVDRPEPGAGASSR